MIFNPKKSMEIEFPGKEGTVMRRCPHPHLRHDANAQEVQKMGL